jgi:hypothetical protein
LMKVMKARAQFVQSKGCSAMTMRLSAKT